MQPDSAEMMLHVHQLEAGRTISIYLARAKSSYELLANTGINSVQLANKTTESSNPKRRQYPSKERLQPEVNREQIAPTEVYVTLYNRVRSVLGWCPIASLS